MISANARRSPNPKARPRRLARLLSTCLALGAAAAPAAHAAGDPASNYRPRIPAACSQSSSSGACVSAGVAALDQSRARLGQPAYQLPHDFTALSQPEQMFVLTDLDRVQSRLPVVPGISATLSAAASAGVHGDADPAVRLGPFDAYASNWAGGYPDAVWAYQAWMYDDGPGSSNLDCTSPGAAGCWGHRNDILHAFSGGGTLTGGFAAGADSAGRPSFAMVLAQQSGHGAASAFAFTWRQALAAGAG